MNVPAPSPLARARAHAAVTALAAFVVIVGGCLVVAGLVYNRHLLLGAAAAVVTFAAFYRTQGYAFDALDRLGAVRNAPTPAAAVHIETRLDLAPVAAGATVRPAAPSRLVAAAQEPGRHRPETFAATYALPAVGAGPHR